MNLPEPDPALQDRLARWEREHGRTYPWRESSSPFHVLTAEIFLQRTRADQVQPVYESFVREIETPAEVLISGRETVDEWFGALGLRWRAEHYWNLCRELVTAYDGEVPAEQHLLLELPGVGQYVCGAVRTYAFDQPTGVIDSNILRVYGRYYGLTFKDSDRRASAVLAWVQDHMPDDPALAKLFSLGLLDLGAAVCKPRNPTCSTCPIQSGCDFAANQTSSC
jgi:A/G-specific adenine glycosylase